MQTKICTAESRGRSRPFRSQRRRDGRVEHYYRGHRSCYPHRYPTNLEEQSEKEVHIALRWYLGHRCWNRGSQRYSKQGAFGTRAS